MVEINEQDITDNTGSNSSSNLLNASNVESSASVLRNRFHHPVASNTVMEDDNSSIHLLDLPSAENISGSPTPTVIHLPEFSFRILSDPPEPSIFPTDVFMTILLLYNMFNNVSREMFSMEEHDYSDGIITAMSNIDNVHANYAPLIFNAIAWEIVSKFLRDIGVPPSSYLYDINDMLHSGPYGDLPDEEMQNMPSESEMRAGFWSNR